MEKEARLNRVKQILSHCRDELSAISISDIHSRLTSEGFAVDRKTVSRDVLEKIPGLISTEEKRTRYYTSRDFKIEHNVKLSSETLLTLFIALESLKNSSHNFFDGMTKEAKEAIGNSLDKNIQSEIQKISNLFHVEPGLAGRPTKSDQKDFNAIIKGLRDELVLELKNNSPGHDEAYNNRIRHFAPIYLCLSGTVAYLLARDLDDHERLKTLRITRISNVRVTEMRFNREKMKKGIDLSRYHNGWGGEDQELQDIEIIAGPEMGLYFKERMIHPSQRVEEIKNNRFKISLRCPIGSDLIRLIRGFGDEVKSVKPNLVARRI